MPGIDCREYVKKICVAYFFSILAGCAPNTYHNVSSYGFFDAISAKNTVCGPREEYFSQVFNQAANSVGSEIFVDKVMDSNLDKTTLNCHFIFKLSDGSIIGGEMYPLDNTYKSFAYGPDKSREMTPLERKIVDAQDELVRKIEEARAPQQSKASEIKEPDRERANAAISKSRSKASDRLVPIEKNAVLYRSDEGSLQLIDALVAKVHAAGYMCNSVSSAIPMIFSYGFNLSCDDFRHKYEIKDVGGTYEVTVDR